MRRLVITVGTSLFTSASWSLESPFGRIPGYRRWVKELLEEPGMRQSIGGRTADEIEERLAERSAQDVDHFAWEPNRVGRYSAEITTLLRWMQSEGGDDLAAFLDGRYQRIDWVCPVDPADPGRIAADHLVEVLHERIGVGRGEVVSAFKSPSIDERVRHFGDYLNVLPASDEVDLVVSGGYKVYAIVASAFAATVERRDRWKVIYVHESSRNELIVQAFSEGWLELTVGEKPLLWGPTGTVG